MTARLGVVRAVNGLCPAAPFYAWRRVAQRPPPRVSAPHVLFQVLRRPRHWSAAVLWNIACWYEQTEAVGPRLRAGRSTCSPPAGPPARASSPH
ncbi:hypothetical protein BU14_0483s0017 [Porphyra umbilicalis]|uniref:Uncharacterized protein n=1 Tax=Porphyra umbilicalis TaxID=2786 RepID=A0A1X6NTS0_PORUM|nr:hypothetical protein BU14_0483s0017 [Porphyra umbilicalis]|eukprot:OSX72004.1 hypothetical protein BU14_0483s0017 [Porphyra umbilicalis]